jgi:hypothetical protein
VHICRAVRCSCGNREAGWLASTTKAASAGGAAQGGRAASSGASPPSSDSRASSAVTAAGCAPAPLLLPASGFWPLAVAGTGLGGSTPALLVCWRRTSVRRTGCIAAPGAGHAGPQALICDSCNSECFLSEALCSRCLNARTQHARPLALLLSVYGLEALQGACSGCMRSSQSGGQGRTDATSAPLAVDRPHAVTGGTEVA